MKTPLPRFTSRRGFLKATGAAVLTTVAWPDLRAADAPGIVLAKKRAIDKAIMWDTLGFQGSVLERFKAVKEAGFDGLEMMSHMKPDEVIEARDQTGLRIPSVCGRHHWGKPLSHPDPKVREEGLAALQQTLREAKRYGATSVLLVPGVVDKSVTYEECWKRSIEGIRQAIPLAEELGVKIAVENVWNGFITKVEQAVAYLDEINSPQVGWHFDIGNILRYSPAEEWIPVLGKRILKLHVKEFSKAKGFDIRYFEGDNNWPAIMKAIDAVGYKGWGISEMPRGQTQDATSLKQFAERMDRVLAS
jgi:hexulose-6-phosphate isomerase